MIATITFDTLSYSKKLKSDGFTEEQVEIIKWVAGMLVAQAAIVATLVKLL